MTPVLPDVHEPAQPLVSIVTPSLNQGRFIDTAIESVAAQDYPRTEHLVMDGGSTDETLAVLARHSPPLRWVSEPDAGQTAALNRGFRLVSGEIVAWLNADDLLLPGAVSAVVDVFRSDPEVMLVYGNGNFIDAAGRHVEPFRFSEPFNLRRLIEVHDYILQPAAFMRRSALEAVGHLDETLSWCMDWDLWIRIGERFRVRYLPIPLATARLHLDSKTSRAGLAKLSEIHRIVRRRSQRSFPPVLFIHGAGTLYRIGRRLVGQMPPDGAPRGRLRGVARRLVDRIIETGQMPWETARPDAGLRRGSPPSSSRQNASGVSARPA
jgi:glycosyltransferase involved in cell wall biosynthesis